MELKNVVIKKVCHSRFCRPQDSGIYNVCRYYNKGNTLSNRYVEDPRLRPSGMTLNLMGFTLIELLVVVLIIGILAAVAVPQYKIAVAKSRYSQVLVLANDILKAEKIYELTNGDWTDDLAKLSLDFPGYKSDKKAYFNGGYCSVTDKTIYCIMHKTASFVSFLNAGKRENHCFFQTGEKADLFEKVCKNMCASNQLKTWPGWDSAKRCKIQ